MFTKGMKRPEGAGRNPKTRDKVLLMREFCRKQCEEAGMPFESVPEMLMWIAIHGKDPLEHRINEELGEKSPFHPSKVNWQDGEGRVWRVGGFIPLETRLDCARIALPHMWPKLRNTEVTGEDGGPVRVQDVDQARQLSRDPAIRRLFEKVVERADALESGREQAEVETEITQGECK